MNHNQHTPSNALKYNDKVVAYVIANSVRMTAAQMAANLGFDNPYSFRKAMADKRAKGAPIPIFKRKAAAPNLPKHKQVKV